MTATPKESVASLRLLVCMAKADGILHDRERTALEASLAEGSLPQDVDVEHLLREDGDFEGLLEQVQSSEARDQTYSACFALACTDGECSPEEKVLLEKMRLAFKIDDGQHEFLTRIFQPKPTVVTGKVGAVPAFQDLGEKQLHEQKVKSETRKTAIISALLGAFPVPGLAIATDLAVTALQVALAKDIAAFWGKELATDTAKGILAAFGVGSGARIAVANLLKVFPGWGSAFGAASAYISTYAVGISINNYFEGGEVDPATLREAFEQAKEEAKQAYDDDKATISEKEVATRARFEELNRKLRAGEISQAQFEAQVAQPLA